ncbi:MAG: four helix bundle protein [Lentimicrobiaceae bacterium]|nr:four helix bundle protein [Lentimicrobiaceae bacterium]
MIGFRDLKVFQEAFSMSMEIFNLTKRFPAEEKYSLIDQIRRSSRSVTANIGEAYRNKQYIAHFKSKISDADMENTETQIWPDYSLACNYISKEAYEKLLNQSDKIGRMLNQMIRNAENFTKNSPIN